ncbi:hypothetical protein RQP53_07005, partial [Paucibacter sp. APW11]|nr:hypothetical protein [Paucibacter sp. APW11]
MLPRLGFGLFASLGLRLFQALTFCSGCSRFRLCSGQSGCRSLGLQCCSLSLSFSQLSLCRLSLRRPALRGGTRGLFTCFSCFTRFTRFGLANQTHVFKPVRFCLRGPQSGFAGQLRGLFTRQLFCRLLSHSFGKPSGRVALLLCSPFGRERCRSLGGLICSQCLSLTLSFGLFRLGKQQRQPFSGCLFGCMLPLKRLCLPITLRRQLSLPSRLQCLLRFVPGLFLSAFSRSAFSRSAFSRSAFSRSAFSRSAFSRSAFSRSAFSRSAFSRS